LSTVPSLRLPKPSELSGGTYNAILRIEVGRTAQQPRAHRRLAVALSVKPNKPMKGSE
jgi:hypothetical protein